ncbi:hypothetical protein COO55_04505 [Rhodococcus opacus]|nr:hypothetical protein COO55_04505 [Rhodococcus opacus]
MRVRGLEKTVGVDLPRNSSTTPIHGLDCCCGTTTGCRPDNRRCRFRRVHAEQRGGSSDCRLMCLELRHFTATSTSSRSDVNHTGLPAH